MEIKRGIAVSSGVAIGPALVLDTEGVAIARRFVPKDAINNELVRYRAAMEAAVLETQMAQKELTKRHGKKYGAIFAAHVLLMEDPELVKEIESTIQSRALSAEYAVSQVMRRHAKALETLEQPLFKTRSSDLFDIEKKILQHLSGGETLSMSGVMEPVIIVAHDLTPSETAALDPTKVQAFATEAGGRASHTAIMAGVLEIPALVGVGRFLTDLSGGDEVIVDGNRGVLIINPDDETRERYAGLRQQHVTFSNRLAQLRDLPATTEDGTNVTLLGNIEFPHEGQHCLNRGADGVGLYRTEFLYVNKQTDPTEGEQYEAFMTVLRSLGPKRPVVIRTLDLGADKLFHKPDKGNEERNPSMGLRSIRLCLRNLSLFKTQLRAILRASHYGDVRVMFPMVTTLLELRQCKMLLAEVKEDLEDEGIPFNRRIPVGTMIEVPSAALMAEEMAKEVQFFSIGTNDLTQYTLAADRTNDAVASLYSAGDPAVLRLIDQVIKAAQKHRIDVSVCGEMSGDPVYTMLLLGLGLRQMSITPQNIPEVKQIIRSITLDQARLVAHEAMRLETAREVNSFLREQTRRILPEVADVMAAGRA